MNWHELFDYRDGELIWKSRPIEQFASPRIGKMRNTRFAGTVAGTLDTRGYLSSIVDGVKSLNHRIIFEMHHGYVPEELDHINGIRTDNRIENLRPATRSQNMQNAKLRKDNTTGVKGVSPHKGVWKVKIYRDKKVMFNKNFEDFELASLVADETRRHYHGAFFSQRT